MVFAHGPLGFLTSWITKPLWEKYKISKQFKILVWIVGYFGGIFPDVDLIYYFTVDASVSHRAMLTHTPFLYIVIFLVAAAVLFLLKKPKWLIIVAVFCIGAFFHILFDMIVSKVMFLYPLSMTFFGVTQLGIEFISNNLRFVNFLVEGIICFFFFYLLIRLFAKKISIRITLTVILFIVFISGVLFLMAWNNHAYHAPRDLHYIDTDQDGILNMNDFDIDGDAILNIDDLDSDGDGIANTLEVLEISERFFNVWYDFSDGHLAQIPARFGFVSNNDTVELLYEAVGIHVTTEMRADYILNQDGYVLPSSSANFGRNMDNVRTWLNHVGRLEVGEQLALGRNNIGDILFFENDYVAVVTGFDNQGQELLLDISSQRVAQELYLHEVIELEGQIKARGKMLATEAIYRDDSN